MGTRGICLLLALTSMLSAEDFHKLPAWAQAAALEVLNKPIPDADAWVVLEQTEMAYIGGGEVRTKHLRVVKILTERGVNEAGYILRGLGGKASRINRLKGWNLRPDGELVKLDNDHVLSSGTSDATSVSTTVATLAVLPRATKGSWVAFESEETTKFPGGPLSRFQILEENPIHRFLLLAAKKEGWFSELKQVSLQLEAFHFKPWLKDAEIQSGPSLQILDLPALPKDEGAQPPSEDVLPEVMVRFEDPELKDVPPTKSWDVFARYFHDSYKTRYSGKSEIGLLEKDPEMGLLAIHRWMTRGLIYRQVYLSPERGWTPERAAETIRKRYGDCKDLASCFVSEARAMGLKAYPVLCKIQEGTAHSSDCVSVASFNHVIAAVQLEKSLGLPAEIETPKGRFLLVDLTSRSTPLGLLPSGHRNREVLICQEAGGLWVHIPISAVQQPTCNVRLDGRVDGPGRLEATLRFQEQGDALGLRSTYLGQGAQGLREFLLRNYLDLPLTGALDLVQVGDPLEIEKPFEVQLRLNHPDGFHLQGQEGILVSWGLPGTPGPIQKPGRPRQFPILIEDISRCDYEATLHLPWPVTPVVTAKKIDTPVRMIDWSAAEAREGAGSVVHLTFREQKHDAYFDYPDREHGLGVWKNDRLQVRELYREGFAFKLLK